MKSYRGCGMSTFKVDTSGRNRAQGEFLSISDLVFRKFSLNSSVENDVDFLMPGWLVHSR